MDTERGRSLRKALRLGTGLTCLALAAFAPPVHAQNPIASAATTENDTTIVVTGSHLKRGFKTPTPMTVETVEDLRLAAPNNIADGLTNLPQFGNNNKTNVGTTSVAVGTTGQNLLNLRGLGFNRNLVLLDGQRMVATNQVGSVDINMLPQAIVSRVDIITGGASATYGSDAISGVVNFVLARTFTGFKADIQGGVSSRGDAPNALASFAWGQSFLDHKLHLVVSGEYFKMKGIDVNDDTHRSWYEQAAGRIANPNPNGTPGIILVDDIRSSVGYPGGFITFAPGNGALQGITFLPGGALGAFDRGTTTGSAFQSGGSGARVNASLVPHQDRYSFFAGMQYDVSDGLSLTADAMASQSHTLQRAFVEPETGAASQFTIFRDNAFMPAALKALMQTNNLASVTVGRYEADFPPVQLEYLTRLERFSARLDGRLAAGWTWDLGAAFNRTDQRAVEGNDVISRNLYAAADAVVDPMTGRTVCRSSLAGQDPGCVPLNIFGLGAPSQAAIHYVLGKSVKTLRLTQADLAYNLRGEIGHNGWAGDQAVSVAAGAEYHQDKAGQVSDALSQTVNDFTGLLGAPSAQQGRQGAFRFFNPQPFSGGIKVTEAYLEIGVPLLRDRPFFKSLDANLASRAANYDARGLVYSFTGGVSSSTPSRSSFKATTWKAGANWSPVDDIRFRMTWSRDIRAPGIIDLYNGSQFSSSTVLYKATTVPLFQLTRGNPDLTPEKARTLTYGIVLNPRFLPALQISADHYDIDVKNAITTLSAQQQVNLCAAGQTNYCALQTFADGALTVITPPFNMNTQIVRGWDIEAQYRARVLGGRLALRSLVNLNAKDLVRPAVGSVIVNRGAPTSPYWRATLQANYKTDSTGVFIEQRIIARSLIDPTLVEGTGISRNGIPAVSYTDVTLTRAINQRWESYFTVVNLFDKPPPPSPLATTTFSIPYNSAYDAIGRAFTLGFRTKT